MSSDETGPSAWDHDESPPTTPPPPPDPPPAYPPPAYPPPAYPPPAYPPPAYPPPAYPPGTYDAAGYGQPAYPQYGAPANPSAMGPYGYGYAAPRQDGMALAAAITSGISALLACGCFIALIGCVVGIVLGFLSRGRIRASDGMLTGEGLALAGIIVGFVGLGLYVLLFLVYGAVLGGAALLG